MLSSILSIKGPKFFGKNVWIWRASGYVQEKHKTSYNNRKQKRIYKTLFYKTTKDMSKGCKSQFEDIPIAQNRMM